MKQSILAVVVFASCATFRRAGHGFTDQGEAFPDGYFSQPQLRAINAEPRLSVKTMPAEAIPDGIKRDRVDTALAALEAEEDQAPAAQAKPAKGKGVDKVVVGAGPGPTASSDKTATGAGA